MLIFCEFPIECIKKIKIGRPILVLKVISISVLNKYWLAIFTQSILHAIKKTKRILIKMISLQNVC